MTTDGARKRDVRVRRRQQPLLRRAAGRRAQRLRALPRLRQPPGVRLRFGGQRAEHRGADPQGDGVAHQRHTHRAGRRRPAGDGRVRAVRLPHVPAAGRLPPGRPVLLQLVAVRAAPLGLLAGVPHHIHMADRHPGRVEVSYCPTVRRHLTESISAVRFCARRSN